MGAFGQQVPLCPFALTSRQSPLWGCQKGWLRALKDSVETTADAIRNLEACVRGVLGAETRGEVLQSVRLMDLLLAGALEL